jgi:hypothetical protein
MGLVVEKEALSRGFIPELRFPLTILISAITPHLLIAISSTLYNLDAESVVT